MTRKQKVRYLSLRLAQLVEAHSVEDCWEADCDKCWEIINMQNVLRKGMYR